MSQAWLAQRERGSLGALRLITWITLNVGYGAGRALLYPICTYFIVFSRAARRGSRDYLERVLGRRVTWRDIVRHYHTFAASILDRVLIARRGMVDIEARMHGADDVMNAFSRGRGLLLLGSHLGSFEVVRAAAAIEPKLIVNIVMHEGNAGQIAAWLRHVAPDFAPRLIEPVHGDATLRIRDALARGEVVAMLGDRPIGRSPTRAISFLGATAQFPTGPARLALALDVPIVTFFGVYRGPRSYDVYFEALAPDRALDRDARVADVVERYVRRLEARARSAPYNWFNFYAFWSEA